MADQRTVKVWGTEVEITIHKHSRTLFIAIGKLRGELIETKGASPKAAAAKWRAEATYRGQQDSDR
jgi:hypothetical protein